MQTESECNTTVLDPHTFGAQSAAWLQGLETQRRKVLSPATIATFSSHVRRLVPLIGADTPLANINSGTLKALVGQLIEEKLSPKTITEMLAVVKQIVASVVDGNGDPLFQVHWNARYIDAPPISKQNRPCPTREQIENAIKNARDHEEQLLIAVLCGTGLRISEALAIRFQGNDQQTSWNASSSLIAVCATIYQGQEQLNHTKTSAGAREVDLYTSLNALITEFAIKSNRQPGDFLFQSTPGKPLQPRAILNRLRKHGVQGFHSARRFRITKLENAGVPRGLIQFWVGHSTKNVTDLYYSAKDIELRKSFAERVGLGFSLDRVGHPAPKPLIIKAPSPPKPTKPDPRRASMVVRHTLVKRHKKRTLAQFIAQNTTKPTGPRFRARDEDLPAALFEPAPTAEVLP